MVIKYEIGLVFVDGLSVISNYSWWTLEAAEKYAKRMLLNADVIKAVVYQVVPEVRTEVKSYEQSSVGLVS